MQDFDFSQIQSLLLKFHFDFAQISPQLCQNLTKFPKI